MAGGATSGVLDQALMPLHICEAVEAGNQTWRRKTLREELLIGHDDGPQKSPWRLASSRRVRQSQAAQHR